MLGVEGEGGGWDVWGPELFKTYSREQAGAGGRLLHPLAASRAQAVDKTLRRIPPPPLPSAMLLWAFRRRSLA